MPVKLLFSLCLFSSYNTCSKLVFNALNNVIKSYLFNKIFYISITIYIQIIYTDYHWNLSHGTCKDLLKNSPILCDIPYQNPW